jgi:hypothetical protein
MRKVISLVMVLIGLFSVASAATWQENLQKLLRSESGPGREELIEAIVKAGATWNDVITQIRLTPFPDTVKGQTILGHITCIDNVVRPWVVYVPSTYNPKVPTPMFVALHGLASRPEIINDPKNWADSTEYVPIAEKRGWIVLIPFAQAGATWWDNVGMTNINNLIRIVKSNFNIDDNRVWMGGFSDGGSAAFLFAMVLPNDFGAFVALNGHMGVGNEDGNLPTYATNFFNTPIYAVTTDKDQLYPSAQMEKLIDMAQKAGGKIFYHQLEGEHSFSYADEELPRIADFLELHPRDPYPTKIAWETAIKEFGVCRWLAIDEITTGEPAPWHVDYNFALVDSSLSIGIIPADSAEVPGVKVSKVVGEENLASQIGLKAGDIIYKLNDIPIKKQDDLTKFKSTIRRGDHVVTYIHRNGSDLVLPGNMPPPKNYLIFKREQPSACIKASCSANRIELESSRVGAFRILIDPEMFDLRQNVIIAVDKKVVFNGRVDPDIRYMLRNFLDNRDRKVIFVTEIKVRL